MKSKRLKLPLKIPSTFNEKDYYIVYEYFGTSNFLKTNVSESMSRNVIIYDTFSFWDIICLCK